MKLEEKVAVSAQPAVFFVHSWQGQKVVRASLTETFEAILKLAGVDAPPGTHVFLGECTDALRAADGEDGHEPVKPQHTPAQHGHHGGHVHCHTCRRITVTVQFNGVTKRHKFSPATTVETAKAWATKRFKLSELDADRLILKVVDSAQAPLASTHLGELVDGSRCELKLELVPDPRVNG